MSNYKKNSLTRIGAISLLSLLLESLDMTGILVDHKVRDESRTYEVVFFSSFLTPALFALRPKPCALSPVLCALCSEL